MSRPEIKSAILIESPAQETDEQFRAYVIELLASICRDIPDWLEFRVGRRVVRRDTQFREFLCIAGSVSAHILLLARRTGGISRTIITYGAVFTGEPVSREIRGGDETEFDSDELQVI